MLEALDREIFSLRLCVKEKPSNNSWPVCIGRILMAAKDRVSFLRDGLFLFIICFIYF